MFHVEHFKTMNYQTKFNDDEVYDTIWCMTLPD